MILDHSQGFNRKCPGVSLLQVSVVCTQPDLPNTFVQVRDAPHGWLRSPQASAISQGDLRPPCSCVCVCCGALQWTDLHQVERLVDGGTSIVYTATYNQMPVIVKVRAPPPNMYTFRRSRPRINVRLSYRGA